MSFPDVIVVGAGVLGLCTAAELAARGRAVAVIDPGGPNASAIAAGMIAPAMESLLEGAPPERAALLGRARALWPDFANRHGLALVEDGARWRSGNPHDAAETLRALGFAAEIRDGDVFAPGDARIEPEAALARLGSGVVTIQGRVETVRRTGAVWVVEGGFGERSARAVVLAAGVEPSIPGLPADVAARIDAVRPIRGQITRVAGSAPGVIRSADGYVAPSGDAVLAGATMEAGRRDLEPDAATTAAQAEVAARLLSRPCAVVEARVGVRGATADGLPLAGPAGAPGLHLALAPRRNGWLLGPLVARIAADGIEGGPAHPDAAALDPLRFG